jgi:hypothetical protein
MNQELSISDIVAVFNIPLWAALKLKKALAEISVEGQTMEAKAAAMNNSLRSLGEGGPLSGGAAVEDTSSATVSDTLTSPALGDRDTSNNLVGDTLTPPLLRRRSSRLSSASTPKGNNQMKVSSPEQLGSMRLGNRNMITAATLPRTRRPGRVGRTQMDS